MKTLEELATLATEKWRPWTCNWYPSEPATSDSIERIQRTLSFNIPKDFIELSRLVKNYGVWFGSIGEDYTSHNHLLRLNEAFHHPDDSSTVLPSHWVLINHGHDGDCDCLDIRTGRSHEYPIYYVNADSPGEPVLIATTFRHYLEKHTESPLHASKNRYKAP